MFSGLLKNKKVLISLMMFTLFIPLSFAQMTQGEKDRLSNRIEGSFTNLDEDAKASINRVNVGLVAGMANPNGAIGSSPEFGVNIGFEPLSPIGVGLEFATTELDKVNLQQTSVLARGSYNLSGDIPVLRDSFLAVTAGPIFTEKNDTEWSIGPVIGFDIPIQKGSSRYLTLGAQARYLLISDLPDTFSASLALKYWY